jgi:curved DNA-binding protein CbpA
MRTPGPFPEGQARGDSGLPPEPPEGVPGAKRRQPDLSPGVTDPYAVLGLSRNADQTEVRTAYFALVRQHPPEQDPETFKRIRAAYDKLRTAQRRAETDLFMLQPPPPWKPPKRQPKANTAVSREEVLAAARAWSDLERDDFTEDFRPIEI